MSAQIDAPIFDWRHPDYSAIWDERLERLDWLEKSPERIALARNNYRLNPISFIEDWGTTFDPRNVGTEVPALMPFVLFPRQREWLQWTLDRWRSKEFGLTEKSRDVGISWLAVAFSSTLCLFWRNMNIGFGSQQQDKVDKLGDPSALFFKAREFLKLVPPIFLGGWEITRHAPHMRIVFPGTGSSMIGECGDQIGRGGRTSIYFIDEAAHLEHPLLVDQSLSATTNVRFDMSSVCGMDNPFAEKAHRTGYPKFTFHWRSDPRKDDAWYADMQTKHDPVTIAQEVDINYSASKEGIIIPSEWVQAAVDAHKRLGIEVSGRRYGALDVADEGRDKNAFAGRHGCLVNFLKSWSGAGGDIFKSVVTTFDLCDQLDIDRFEYDADGLGAGVRGDARVINEARYAAGKRQVVDEPFRGSGAVFAPEAQMVPKRLNKDYFSNLKAQSWWSLRLMFQETARAIGGKEDYDRNKIISLSSEIPQTELTQLCMELSQPTYHLNISGKIVVDKQPDGSKSPNLGDAVMILFQPGGRRMEVWGNL